MSESNEETNNVERIRKSDGFALRRLRERAWKSQLELAELSGVSRATISDIERGRNTSPRNATLMALARALEVPPDALVSEEDGTDPLAAAHKAAKGVVRLLSDPNAENAALGNG